MDLVHRVAHRSQRQAATGQGTGRSIQRQQRQSWNTGVDVIQKAQQYPGFLADTLNGWSSAESAAQKRFAEHKPHQCVKNKQHNDACDTLCCDTEDSSLEADRSSIIKHV